MQALLCASPYAHVRGPALPDSCKPCALLPPLTLLSSPWQLTPFLCICPENQCTPSAFALTNGAFSHPLCAPLAINALSPFLPPACARPCRMS